MPTDRHTLELEGYNALLADHCELTDRVARLEADVLTLVAGLRLLGCTVTIAEEIVEDYGHGVKLIRRRHLDGDDPNAHTGG